MEEIWKDVVGYEGYYQVSNNGSIKCVDRIIYDKRGRPSTRPECILKPHISKRGYATASLWKGHKKTGVRVHRVVAQCFIPNPDNKPTVNHINGNKTDNRAVNLEWSTNMEQSQHAMESGLMTHRGSGAYNTVLNESQVMEIRSKYSFRKYTMVMLAKEYGTTRGTVDHIIRGTTWKHI